MRDCAIGRIPVQVKSGRFHNSLPFLSLNSKHELVQFGPQLQQVHSVGRDWEQSSP